MELTIEQKRAMALAQARLRAQQQQAPQEPVTGQLSPQAAASLAPQRPAIPQDITQMLEADKVTRATGQNTALDTDPNLRFSHDRPSQGGSFGIGAANGGLLGFSDNIGGLGAAILGNNRQGEFFDYSGTSFGDRYAAGRDRSRLRLDSARNDNPLTTLGGELAGGITTGVAALPRTVGSTALGTAGRGAGVGALEGGTYGAGNADGENVAESALLGATLGGGVGLAAQPVVQGVRAAGRAVAAPVAGAFNAATGRASQSNANAIAQRAVSRSGMTMDDIQRQAVEASQAGQPMVLADILGAPGQGALNGAARSPGAAQRELMDFLETRQAGAADRTRRALADGLGAPDTAAQRTEALTAQRTADANINYPAARDGAGPVDVRGALGVIDSRLGQTADAAGTGFQGDSIDGAFSQFRNRLAADRVPGDIDAMELSDFNRVLGVKQDLGDAIQSATRAGQNNRARELTALQRELDKALEASSDGYRTANDTFARQSGDIEAVAQGTNAARSTRRAEDVVEEFRGLGSPERQSAFRAGMADPFMARIGNAGDATDVTRGLRTPDMKTILDEVAIDPANLQSQIAREQAMFQTGKRALGGSATANNLADMMDNQGVDVGMLANLARGQLGQAAQQGAQKVANVATNQTEGTNQLLARILMSDNPQQALAPVLAQQMRREGRQVGGEAAVRTASNRSSEDARERLLARILGE